MYPKSRIFCWGYLFIYLLLSASSAEFKIRHSPHEEEYPQAYNFSRYNNNEKSETNRNDGIKMEPNQSSLTVREIWEQKPLGIVAFFLLLAAIIIVFYMLNRFMQPYYRNIMANHRRNGGRPPRGWNMRPPPVDIEQGGFHDIPQEQELYINMVERRRINIYRENVLAGNFGRSYCGESNELVHQNGKFYRQLINTKMLKDYISIRPHKLIDSFHIWK